MRDKQETVMRLRITLSGIKPYIWRLIDVPIAYSLWDLHVAIQDAMGWHDCHLHAFMPPTALGQAGVPIGIPADELDADTMASWSVPITECFTKPGDTVGYEYDFGDSWYHEIELIAVQPKAPGQTYPCCIDGARACPPEDCGGILGYCAILEALSDPHSPEYISTVEWLQGYAKEDALYDPAAFDPAAVHFDDPEARFEYAFGRG